MNLSEITGAGGPLFGYQLSQATLETIAQVEEFFAGRYLSMVAKAAGDLSPGQASALRAGASALVLSGAFAYGGAGFDSLIDQPTALPHLLWLILRIKQPLISQHEAADLVTNESFPQIRRAVLECFGYSTSPNAVAPANGKTGSSTGAESTEDCDSADCDRPISAA